MQLSYYINFKNLSSDKNRADDFLTKILNFNNQNQIKKLLKFPNVEIEIYSEIVKNWLLCNKEMLTDKLYLVLEELGKEKNFEYSEDLHDLYNEIRLILEQVNSLIFSKNVNLFA